MKPAASAMYHGCDTTLINSVLLGCFGINREKMFSDSTKSEVLIIVTWLLSIFFVTPRGLVR
eukprot:4582317-Prorocentrum_lima.AAC.1